jgi:hypothetical protein
VKRSEEGKPTSRSQVNTDKKKQTRRISLDIESTKLEARLKAVVALKVESKDFGRGNSLDIESRESSSQS